MCYSVLQCVAVCLCCSVLQCVAVRRAVQPLHAATSEHAQAARRLAATASPDMFTIICSRITGGFKGVNNNIGVNNNMFMNEGWIQRC